MTDLGVPFQPTGFPTEFLSLGGIGPGVPVRATVSDFGPQLLAKILKANDTQEQSLELVFHYADSKQLPLLDLADLRALLTFLESDEGKAELEGIGGLAKATVGVLLRGAGRPRGRRRQRVLRRAAARHQRPAAHGARRARRHLGARAARGPGQARAVLDRADVARRGAVRDAARGRRPAQAQARLLPRRGAPAVRRRHRRVRAVGRADRAPDSLQGRRGVLRDADAEGRARSRSSPSSATASSTRCARSRPTTPRRSRRRSRRSRSPTSTTSRSCSRRWASARRP